MATSCRQSLAGVTKHCVDSVRLRVHTPCVVQMADATTQETSCRIIPFHHKRDARRQNRKQWMKLRKVCIIYLSSIHLLR